MAEQIESEPSRQSEPAGAARGTLAASTRVLLTLAAAVVVIVGFALGRDVIGPIILAAVIVIIVHPIRGALDRRNAPRWLATITVIVVAYLILVVMALLIALAAHQFVALVVQDADSIRDVVASATADLKHLGIDVSQAGAAIDPKTVVSVVQSVAGYIGGLGITLFLILAYILFMAADAARFSAIPSDLRRAKAATILSFREYTSAVRRYFVVSAIFGLIVAILDGLLLWILGVPGAFIWAVLAFVTNFVPNIGFIIGLIPAAVFALLSGGWVVALIVIIAYCAINAVMQELIQPKFVSDAVHLSLTLTFASVIFWAAVIGPLGALLAIPLTLLVRELVIGTDPDAAWSRWLTSN